MKYSNAVAAVSVIAADIGIVALSLVFWGKGGAVMVDISAWAFCVAAIGGILNAGNGILEGVGWRLPLGRPMIPSPPLSQPNRKPGTDGSRWPGRAWREVLRLDRLRDGPARTVLLIRPPRPPPMWEILLA